MAFVHDSWKTSSWEWNQSPELTLCQIATACVTQPLALRGCCQESRETDGQSQGVRSVETSPGSQTTPVWILT